MRPSLLLAALLVAACDSLPPPPSTASEPAAPCGSSARPWGTPGCPSTTAAPPSPRALPSAAPVAAPRLPAGATPSVVEVEVSGRVVPPRDAPAGRLLVALTDGPCFQPGTHYITWTQPAAGGNYRLGAFPSVGTQLEVCGAVVEPGKQRLSWWARADRGTLPAQGRGKSVFSATDVLLRRAPDVPLPVGLGPAN